MAGGSIALYAERPTWTHLDPKSKYIEQWQKALEKRPKG